MHVYRQANRLCFYASHGVAESLSSYLAFVAEQVSWGMHAFASAANTYTVIVAHAGAKRLSAEPERLHSASTVTSALFLPRQHANHEA